MDGSGTVITVGLHAGRTIEWIAEHDPGDAKYLLHQYWVGRG